MTWQENLFQNIITIFVLTALFMVIYLRATNQTLPELIKEIREVFQDQTPVIEAQGGLR